MIYKFKSKAAGDVIMLGPNGDRILEIIGRSPAPKGILEVEDLPAAIAALETAIAQAEAARGEAPPEEPADDTKASAVSLRQRAWPLLEMMRRSLAARVDIVWGV